MTDFAKVRRELEVTVILLVVAAILAAVLTTLPPRTFRGPNPERFTYEVYSVEAFERMVPYVQRVGGTLVLRPLTPAED